MQAGREPDLTQIDALPALAYAREHVLQIASRRHNLAELVLAIEGDPGLTLAVLRSANRGRARGAAASVADAVSGVSPGTVAATVADVPVIEPLGPSGVATGPMSFRLHAVSVRVLAERLAGAVGFEDVNRLVSAALLHDVGKLALERADPAYRQALHPVKGTPEARLEAEREIVGFDHTEAGGRLAEQWGFPASLASVLAGHHNGSPDRATAIVRLADMLSHYAHERPIDIDALVSVSDLARLDRYALSELLYELPESVMTARRDLEPSPLSDRERQVLEALAEGKLPKEIAHELGLSPSTVRNHLHRIYARIGAADRTQAILIARERGWI